MCTFQTYNLQDFQAFWKTAVWILASKVADGPDVSTQFQFGFCENTALCDNTIY